MAEGGEIMSEVGLVGGMEDPGDGVEIRQCEHSCHHAHNHREETHSGSKRRFLLRAWQNLSSTAFSVELA